MQWRAMLSPRGDTLVKRHSLCSRFRINALLLYSTFARRRCRERVGRLERGDGGSGVRRGAVGVRGPAALRTGRVALRRSRALPRRIRRDRLQYVRLPRRGPVIQYISTCRIVIVLLHCPLRVVAAWKTTCGAGQFRCASSGRCIAAAWRCDGEADCGPHDASDEEPYMCEKDFECGASAARCATPEDGLFSCVPVYQFCDGVRHCLDGSDEWDICDNCEHSPSAMPVVTVCRFNVSVNLYRTAILQSLATHFQRCGSRRWTRSCDLINKTPIVVPFASPLPAGTLSNPAVCAQLRRPSARG